MFGLIPLIGIFLSAPLWGKFVPFSLVTPIIIGIPAAIGVGVRHLIRGKQKIKERLHSFSKAKKQKEIREELIKVKIEQAKLQNINKTIEYVYNSLDMGTEYNIIKNKLSWMGYKIDEIEGTKNLNKVRANKGKLERVYVEYQQHIQKLTEDYTLASEDTENSLIKTIMCGCLIGTLFLFFCRFPLMRLNVIGNDLNIFKFLLPMIISSGSIITYGTKRYFDIKSANKNIAHEIGSEVLYSDNVYEKQKRLEQQLSSIIQKTAELQIKYEIESETLAALEEESQAAEEKYKPYTEEEIREYMKPDDVSCLIPQDMPSEEGPVRNLSKNN